MYHGWKIHIFKQFSGFAFPEISSGLTEQHSFPVDCSGMEKVCDKKRSTLWDKTKYSNDSHLQISAPFDFPPKLRYYWVVYILEIQSQNTIVQFLISGHMLVDHIQLYTAQN